MDGWIKLHRKIVEWEWFSDGNTFRVFMYLLLTANHKDSKFQGAIIKRGQSVFGRKMLAEKLTISEQNVKTAIVHLISTNEITIKSTNKYTVATIVNYEAYQQKDDESNQQGIQQSNQQLTNEQPTTNQQLTTSKNVRMKECKNISSNEDIGGSGETDSQNNSVPYVKIMELYNGTCISLPKIRIIDGERKKAVNARYKTYGGIETFQTLFQKAEASCFLKGGGNKNWHADFDWLVNATNMAKVLEGKYDDKGGGAGGNTRDNERINQEARKFGTVL